MGCKGITRERTGLILQELLKVLWAFADGLPAEKAVEMVTSRIKLTEHEKGDYPNGERRFDKILLFCTIDAVKAGWMLKSGPIWSITAEGKAALAAYPQPVALYREVSRLYRQWRRERECSASACFEEAETNALKEIHDFLDNMDPHTFQDLVSALLHTLGYVVGWVSPGGREGGMAFLAWNDHDGKCPPNIKVQVRRRGEKIEFEEMSAFLASINSHEVGIFFATGGFTREARELADAKEGLRIELFDTKSLVNLWIRHHHRMNPRQRALLPLRPIYFIAPADGGRDEVVQRRQPSMAAALQHH